MLVYHLQHDHTQADVEPVERAILDYAIKLNNAPGAVGEADLAPLRDHGLDDRAILDIVMVVSLFNFMNRMADALGVESEASMEKSRERGEARAVAQLAAAPAQTP